MMVSVDDIAIISALFFVVFVLNVIPAFAPPTWMTLSFVGLTLPSVNVMVLALVGAVAAIARRNVRHGLCAVPVALGSSHLRLYARRLARALCTAQAQTLRQNSLGPLVVPSHG